MIINLKTRLCFNYTTFYSSSNLQFSPTPKTCLPTPFKGLTNYSDWFYMSFIFPAPRYVILNSIHFYGFYFVNNPLHKLWKHWLLEPAVLLVVMLLRLFSEQDTLSEHWFITIVVVVGGIWIEYQTNYKTTRGTIGGYSWFFPGSGSRIGVWLCPSPCSIDRHPLFLRRTGILCGYQCIGLNILEACRQAKTRRVVVTSPSEVYGLIHAHRWETPTASAVPL